MSPPGRPKGEYRSAQHGGCPLNEPVRILGAGLSGLACGIALARAGREVVIHELREDSGARFADDFQGIENWTSDVDFFDEMRQWGIATDGFDATELREISVIGADDSVARFASRRVACRVVRRGTLPGCLDQGLKADALRQGVEIRYGSRVEPDSCDVIATGPRGTSGIVRAELFETEHPDQVTLQLNQALAPGTYTYLVIVQGVGMIATVLLRREHEVDAYLDATIAAYQRHYPALQRRNPHRITGAGCFALAGHYKEAARCYVGEAAGLQDCFWGFGIRYAITSGWLAAQEILTGASYEQAVRRRLRPLQVASLANRLAIDSAGASGLALLLKAWQWDQRRCGDGLRFLSRIYRPTALHRAVYGCFATRLLAPPSERDAARGLRYLRFRDHKPG
ncbi:NAD(P)-binding protein [Ramlibacter sp. G-1-2-2]|uniref:NAD(P)-binding protein n=1 Tax=Ramlibacter agri TaxID=2728837 RepID=A0A848H261_9BURK|nr:NAD(P)-binding protein [Ramlibacter agri]NML45066.1 NAD(P)-binding protein [Ramlibacter agri]